MNEPGIFENPCAICRKKEAVNLCDYIVEYMSIVFIKGYKEFVEENACRHDTCDLPMCVDCSKEINTNIDFCPHHFKLYGQARLSDDLERARMRVKVESVNLSEN